MNDNGYVKSHNYQIDRTDDDGTDVFTAELDGGEDFKIVAVCDEDCDDIDINIKVYDLNGNLVAEDVETDDYPEVNVRPRYTSRFRIKVIMYNCGESYCYYGIGIYQD